MEQHHRRLFTAAWWQEMQRRNLQGEVIDFFPYAAEKRFVGEVV
jgi:isocitrate dehydrogenase kinase/phosphatase